MWNLILLLLGFVTIYGVRLVIIEKDNRLPKTLNLIILVPIFYSIGSGELFEITRMVFDLKGIISSEYSEFGLLTPEISMFSYIINIILSLNMAFTIIGVISHKEQARSRFIKILPFFLVTQLVESYKVFIKESYQFDFNPFLYYGLAVIILSLLVLALYSTSYMKRIFTK